MLTEEEELELLELEDAEARQKKSGGFGSGVVQGLTDPIYGISQLMPRAVSAAASLGGLAPNRVSEFYAQDAKRMDALAKQREQEYQAQKQDGFDWGRLTGNVVNPMNFIGAGASKLPAVAGAVKAAPSFAAQALRGAGQGAGFAATMPVTEGDYTSGKTAQMAAGAAGGFAAPFLSRAMNPNISPEVAKLIKEKIPLTAGQIMGGGFKRAEDALTSVPVLGDLIRGAQNRSFKALNTAAINRALEPVGLSLPKGMVGREAIEFAQNKLGQAYDDLLPSLTGRLDDQFMADIRDLSSSVTDDFVMNSPEKQKFTDILSKKVLSRFSNGGTTGQAIKDIESELGNLAATFKKSSSASENQLGDALDEVVASLRGAVERSNPEKADILRKINSGWANFKRVQRAAGSVGAEGGVFTPAQLQGAVKALDRSKDKGAFARGGALMQDLSDAARNVLPSKLADSGTAGRIAYGIGVGGGGMYAADRMGIDPMYALPLAMLAPAYVNPTQRIAQAVLAQRPEMIRRAAPYAAKYAQAISAPLAVSQMK